MKVFPRRAAVPLDLWGRLAEQAVSEIGILVFSGLFLPEQVPQLVRLLKEKAHEGVNIRILLGDPDSEAVSNRGAEEGIGESMASKIRNVLAFYRPLQGVAGVNVKFHSTTLYNSIYRFDGEMLVNTHAYGFPAAHAPVLHLRRLSSGELFDTYADSFDRVWSSGKPVW
ncbi:hypothetical protein [Actinoplanes sp. NPDC051859]|uniref:hypothetical protein n=1 Tax=Actinoplanes sp. NPDC051859 TaxID=3363909 RepID=UPI0037B516D9